MCRVAEEIKAFGKSENDANLFRRRISDRKLGQKTATSKLQRVIFLKAGLAILFLDSVDF